MGDIADWMRDQAMIDDRIENDDYEPGWVDEIPNDGPIEVPLYARLDELEPPPTLVAREIGTEHVVHQD